MESLRSRKPHRFYHFFYLFIFLFLLVSLSSCTYEEVEIAPVNKLSILRVGPRTVSFELYLTIVNPNQRTFTIRSIDLQMTINGTVVGKITSDEPMKVEADSQRIYPLRLEFHLDSWMKGVKALADVATANKIEMTLTGTATISSFLLRRTVPVDHTLMVDVNRNTRTLVEK